jgi:segregation and condensation protein A
VPPTADSSSSLFEGSSSAYSVKLDTFEGPLDLLLHLIRKNELDIYDIPIALITKQYLEYLSFLKELNLEVAGDFLVMASTLLQIKSRMLLPNPEPEEGEGEQEEDPRAELVRRLLDYQRYKEAGQHLGERELLGREVFARRITDPDLLPVAPEEGPLELDLFELAEAFRSLLARVPTARVHEVIGFESVSIADAINEILSLLQEREMLAFDELFSLDDSRERLIVNFLALLELCRLKMSKVLQNTDCGIIYIYPAVAIETADGVRGGDTLP